MENIEFEDYLLEFLTRLTQRYGSTHKEKVLAVGTMLLPLVREPKVVKIQNRQPTKRSVSCPKN